MSSIIQFEQVSKSYADVTAVRDLSLSLESGQVSAILGPNGAGKTTSVHLMMGLLKPTRGRIEVLGYPPGARQSRRRMGAMLQISGLPDTLKVSELLNLFRSYYPNPDSADNIVQLAGIEAIMPRRFGQLSGGEKQRVLFAMSICGQPDLLFLDEPTVGMDVKSRHRFWEAVRQMANAGRAVVLTTHYLEEADALADRVLVIDQGSLVADGTPGDIKKAVPSRRVRCRTRLQPAQVETFAGADHVAREGGLLSVATSDAENLVRALLAADPELSELEVSKADLAQAFLSLTADPAQEAA
ncbi:MAG: ABC transporter ATP-binding protein [Pseudomonadota bacterium]